MAQAQLDVDPFLISPAYLAHHVDEKWLYAPHIQLMVREIQRTIAMDDGRLMIFMPPRHAKSETTSHYTPPWYLGRDPERRVILASYEADFAASWGRKCRDVLVNYGPECYGVRLRGDSAAVNRWELESYDQEKRSWEDTGGGMVTAGVGGPITGRGMDLGIIDDPVKNAQDSLSKKLRETNWDWYLSTFYTRREPGASIILIMTRWHEDDLAGRILAEDEGDWRILSLPAIATQDEDFGIFKRKEGEALWPRRYPVETLLKTKATVGAYFWAALYQQDPQPQSELGIFKREWFEMIDAPPGDQAQRIRFWDLAGTLPKDPSEDPDWTAGCLMSRTDDGYFIEDVQRIRDHPGAVEDFILRIALEDGRDIPVRLEQEPGSSGKFNTYNFVRALDGWDVGGIQATGKKELRANPLSAQAQAHRVHVVRAGWNKVFFDELTRFPYADHDDQVDASSGAYQWLLDNYIEPVEAYGIERTSPWRF